MLRELSQGRRGRKHRLVMRKPFQGKRVNNTEGIPYEPLSAGVSAGLCCIPYREDSVRGMALHNKNKKR